MLPSIMPENVTLKDAKCVKVQIWPGKCEGYYQTHSIESIVYIWTLMGKIIMSLGNHNV